MKEREGRGPHRARKPYAAPQLRRVRLVPDEAVLATCKNQTTPGPAGAIQKCAGGPPTCWHNGS
jgi:hypothetical protein